MIRCAALLFLLFVQDDPLAGALKEIDRDEMKTVLTKLASDDFEGRRTGSKGITKARDYMVSLLKQWGVKPVDGSYVHDWGTCHNVMAFHEGSDPELKKEIVILGSHYDHLGTKSGEDDGIFNGADDNGSGSTLNLFVAKALASGKLQSKRSILHLWFSGEEQGLNGAKSWCQKPALPLERVVAMVNCDMVGRTSDQGSDLYGIGSSLQFGPLTVRARELVPAAKVNLIREKGQFFHRSDQNVFWSRGIPVMFLFSGLHADYHKPSDEAEKIHYERLADLAKYVLVLVVELGNLDGKIERNPEYK
jgi:hypothetical protein